MPSPSVSVIMNCYNGAKYLQESLRSVINQTYQNWELIFWDNISSDDSKKIFSNFNENRFKYFLNDKHSILYHARNQAIKKANGEFIAFLDTDEEVVQRTGVSIAYIFDVEGEEGFREREHQALKRLIEKENAVVATGGGIVTYFKSRIVIQERKNVVYLKTSIEKQIERATVSDNRPLLIDIDPASKLEELMLTREALYEEISDIKIDTDKSTPRQIALEIIDRLK